MKDLIDYSRETGTGPMESLAKFPRRSGSSAGVHGPSQPSEDLSQQQQQQQPQPPQQQQQTASQNSNHESSVQAGAMQLASSSSMPSVNNSLNPAPATSSSSTIVGLLHQNSFNSRQQTPMNGANSPYAGSTVQMPSPSSSSTMPHAQPNLPPFQSPTVSSSNNPPQTSQGGLSSGSHINSASSANISMHQPPLSGDIDANDSQSSVQKIIHEIMMSSQLGGGGVIGGGAMGNDVKSANGMMATRNNSVLNGSNCLVGNGTANANIGMGAGYGSMGNGLSQIAMVNGIWASLGNNSGAMNGRVGMTMAREPSTSQQQEDLGNQLLSSLGAVNSFNNIPFDWKTSP